MNSRPERTKRLASSLVPPGCSLLFVDDRGVGYRDEYGRECIKEHGEDRVTVKGFDSDDWL